MFSPGIWWSGLRDEPSGIFRPALTNELVGREPSQRLEAPSEVVGCDELGEVLPELVVADVVEALDRRVLDRQLT